MQKNLKRFFEKAFSLHKPCIIDAKVDIDEMVLPMVPGGKPIDQPIMCWDN